MDRLLGHCGHSSDQERFMDSNVLEKERGITISSKYTSLQYGKYTLNAVDTPGHADFGGEVERILGMVDGAVLLVDANEGPLQQTKFVVEKALKAGIRPIVVLNKVDRPGATKERCGEVESNIFDLFAQMGATEEQLDFQVLYASAREGWASKSLPEQGSKPEGASVAPLLDAIVEHVPPPAGDPAAPFAMLVAMVEHDSFLGPIATGRVAAGTARTGDRVRVLHHTGAPGEEGRLTKVWKRSGLGRLELEAASAGDIVSITGAGTARIADTVGSPDLEHALSPGVIEPPTLSMVFSPNDSPLAGREGTQLTGSKIGERLAAEAATSVSLRVVPVDGGGEAFEVQARGELQLGLLIENMRREGFELSVSPPRVVYREEGGHKLEPLEEVICEVEEDQAGSVIEALSLRKGDLLEMVPQAVGGKQRLVFEAPSRGLIGFRSAFATLTRGTGMLHRAFSRYGRFKGPLDGVRKGVLISTADGKTTLHALGSLEARGSLFTGVGTEVYTGMIIGECARENNLEVNPVREKKLSNVRASGADEKTYLTPPRLMTLEDAIGYVQGDELMEVTPKSIRLRKQLLDSSQRKSLKRKTG
ncbi:g9589 [Coccomyxa elongata]